MILVYLKAGIDKIHNSDSNVNNNDDISDHKSNTIMITVTIILEIYK